MPLLKSFISVFAISELKSYHWAPQNLDFKINSSMKDWCFRGIFMKPDFATSGFLCFTWNFFVRFACI